MTFYHKHRILLQNNSNSNDWSKFHLKMYANDLWFIVFWYHFSLPIFFRVAWPVHCTGNWHNGHYGISNHQPYDCLLNRLFRCRSKKTLQVCITGLCKGNSPVTGEFPTQRANEAENVAIWWRHHGVPMIFSLSVPDHQHMCYHDILEWLFCTKEKIMMNKYHSPG